MLEIINNIGKQRVASIDLQNIYAHVAIASPSTNNSGYNQVMLERLLVLDDTEKLKEAIHKEKLSLVSYLASGSEALVEATTTSISGSNIEHYKRDLGISNHTHIIDYFNFYNSGLICGFPVKSSNNASHILSQMFSKSINLIGQSDIALVNFYCKIYPSADKSRTAILSVGSEHTSIVVVDKLIPVCAGSLKFNLSEIAPLSSLPDSDPSPYSPLSIATTLFHEAKNALPKERETSDKLDFDLVLLVGECDDSFLRNLKAIFLNEEINISVGAIEFFNPLIYNYISIEALGEREKQLVQSEGHKFGAVIAGAAMALEFAGVDLSIEQKQLYKEFTSDVYFYTPQSYALKGLELVVNATDKVRKAVATQTTVLSLAIIVALTLLGYNYYQTSQQLTFLDNSILQEKSSIDSLKDLEEQYQEHKKKVDIKKERIETIEQIQTTQLTIPTIVKALQTAQYPLNGLMKFNSLEVNGREIKINGESIDKRETIAFLKQLSDTGAFLDLNPVYDSNDSVKCRYSLTTKYSGPVQANQIKLPISNTFELAPGVGKKESAQTNSSQSLQSINQVTKNTANDLNNVSTASKIIK